MRCCSAKKFVIAKLSIALISFNSQVVGAELDKPKLDALTSPKAVEHLDKEDTADSENFIEDEMFLEFLASMEDVNGETTHPLDMLELEENLSSETTESAQEPNKVQDRRESTADSKSEQLENLPAVSNQLNSGKKDMNHVKSQSNNNKEVK